MFGGEDDLKPLTGPSDGPSTHTADDFDFDMGRPYKRDEDGDELEEEVEDDSSNHGEYDMDDVSDHTDPRGNPWEQMTEQEQMDFAEDVINEHCYQEDPETDYPDMKDWKTRRKTIANDGEWYQNVLYERLLSKWAK